MPFTLRRRLPALLASTRSPWFSIRMAGPTRRAKEAPMPEDHGFPMQLEVTEVPSRRLAGVRHQGPYPRISEAFLRLFPQADALGLSRVAGAVYVALYYDDPESTPEDALRSLAAVTVAEDATIGELEDERLPSGRFVRMPFFGPHSDLGEAWRHLNH